MSKVLTVRFIDSGDIISRLITWTTNSLWCHTEALSRDGKSWIGAHSGTGVQARPLDWCVPTRERRYEVPVTDEQYETAMTFLESKQGCPYNYMDIVGLALHKRIGETTQRIICSALMLEFLMKGGHWPLNTTADFSYLITPETLHLSPTFLNRCVYSHG